MVHKTIIARDSERIYIAGRVRHIKCPYKGFNRARLTSIRAIESQIVKDNFATRKHHHLKLATRKFIILKFQLIKSNWQLEILTPTHKINLQLVKLLCKS